MRKIFFMMLMIFSQFSSASEIFKQHANFVMRAASALNMYILTYGDERYLYDLEKYLIKANISLDEVENRHGNIFLDRWSNITPLLVFYENKHGEIDVEMTTRVVLNRYIYDVNVYLMSISENGKSLANMISNIKTSMLLLSFRSIESASSPTGRGLSMINSFDFDSGEVISKVKQDFARIGVMIKGNSNYEVFERFKTKFKFVEKYLYSPGNKVPFYLLYNNMKNIEYDLKFIDAEAP